MLFRSGFLLTLAFQIVMSACKAPAQIGDLVIFGLKLRILTLKFRLILLQLRPERVKLRHVPISLNYRFLRRGCLCNGPALCCPLILLCAVIIDFMLGFFVTVAGLLRCRNARFIVQSVVTLNERVVLADHFKRLGARSNIGVEYLNDNVRGYGESPLTFSKEP